MEARSPLSPDPFSLLLSRHQPPHVPWPNPRPTPVSQSPVAGFLLQCSLYFELQPHQFVNDRAKIAFIMSLLFGRALQGVELLWNSLSPLVCSLDAFVDHFWDVFGKSTSAASMHDDLFQLRQADMSIHNYTVRFHTLAASSGWNETALLSAFRRGLNPFIRQQISIYEDTVGLERLLQKALRVSQHLTSCHTGLLVNLDPRGSVSHSLLLDLPIRIKIRTVIPQFDELH